MTIKQFTMLKNTFQWVKFSKDNPPPIVESNEWSKKIMKSRRVLTFSKEYGMRLGFYLHSTDSWFLDGIHSHVGVQVEWFAVVEIPC